MGKEKITREEIVKKYSKKKAKLEENLIELTQIIDGDLSPDVKKKYDKKREKTVEQLEEIGVIVQDTGKQLGLDEFN